MTLEARAESNSFGLCLARRNYNKIELFLNLLAKICIIPELSLYLSQVLISFVNPKTNAKMKKRRISVLTVLLAVCAATMAQGLKDVYK